MTMRCRDCHHDIWAHADDVGCRERGCSCKTWTPTDGLAPAPQVEPLDDMPGALHYALGHMSDECDCDRIWSDIRRFHELQPDPLPVYSAAARLQASPQPESPVGWTPYFELGTGEQETTDPQAESRAIELLRELVDAASDYVLRSSVDPTRSLGDRAVASRGAVKDAIERAARFLQDSAIPASSEDAT